MTVAFQPIRVETGSDDDEGQLVLSGSKLVAVLVKLSLDHGDASGLWFMEKGFGAFNGPGHPTFADLPAAQEWFRKRMAKPYP
jgi:hypothetical protein